MLGLGAVALAAAFGVAPGIVVGIAIILRGGDELGSGAFDSKD